MFNIVLVLRFKLKSLILSSDLAWLMIQAKLKLWDVLMGLSLNKVRRLGSSLNILLLLLTLVKHLILNKTTHLQPLTRQMCL